MLRRTTMRAAPTAVSDPHVRASRPYRTVVRLWTAAGATVSTVHVQSDGHHVEVVLAVVDGDRERRRTVGERSPVDSAGEARAVLVAREGEGGRGRADERGGPGDDRRLGRRGVRARGRCGGRTPPRGARPPARSASWAREHVQEADERAGDADRKTGERDRLTVPLQANADPDRERPHRHERDADRQQR